MTQEIQAGSVVAVSRARSHRFSKPNEMSIRLLEGLGVEGDAHMGVTVQHSYHMRKTRSRPICGRCISCMRNCSMSWRRRAMS